MYEFKDLGRLTKIACFFVASYLVVDTVMSLGAVIEGPPAYEGDVRISDFVALLDFLIIIATLCVVGRWIYRASTIAHAVCDQMSITPGWAVGWYFVPFANLIKPFHAMKEIWFASHQTDGSYEERAPGILALWWTLWIVNNVVGNVILQMTIRGGADQRTIDLIGLVSATVNIPLCLVLIRIMREVSQSQNFARHEATFA